MISYDSKEITYKDGQWVATLRTVNDGYVFFGEVAAKTERAVKLRAHAVVKAWNGPDITRRLQ